ncbi:MULTISPECIES: hypothetical protein [unclassified Mucilaginibacter]|uniref:hypothetical protein n=1 Tax=unclassified Mucilaginibacter TaxID=2617802 RepID=UPI00095963E4|nr:MULTISPECIES: hypothetical protein [unclassified Mucilaginibacter]OJW13831.1 MAG: hypothetical protein BGO48_03675 [Mucilaginibacter sp. 44-25]PLW90959.1 MAG: hypothetical protein C0154_03780 [Mucilaginibacter sp.]PMP66372.1 MAG: hypothetical protein C0191_00855 [Mucilaginibacter sp.]HEK22376.1 hypothetical protein [Bacteroidota bacterium]
MQHSTQNANSEKHYIALILAVAIGLVGVFIRFADFHWASATGNILMGIGTILVLRAVFAILK